MNRCFIAILPFLFVFAPSVTGEDDFFKSANTTQAGSPPESEALPSDLDAKRASASTASATPSFQENARYYTLGELIAQALKTNPRTHVAWQQLLADQAALAKDKADAYAQVDVGGTLSASVRDNDAGRRVENSELGPYAEINYLLYDGGQRDAREKENQHRVLAASHRHDAAIQEVILNVQRAYYHYLTLRYQTVAQETVIAEAESSVAAAEQRRLSGVTGVADVLQAKTALSQARLKLHVARGQMKALKGAVMTRVGLPLTLAVDVVDVPIDNLPVDTVKAGIQSLLERARDHHPLLQVARAQAAAAQAHIAAVKARDSVAITALGRIDELYNSGELNEELLGQIQIQYPLFTGYHYTYALQQAEAEAARQQADYKLVEEQRLTAVWESYYAHQTAIATMAAAAELFTHATQSHEIARERYREGVGDILQVLAAQSALESARFSRIQARMDWLLTLAQLQYDLGVLEPTATIPETVP